MRIQPDNYAQDYHHGRAPEGRQAGYGPGIDVDLTDEEQYIRLSLDPLHAETIDDRDIDRDLTSAEARDLAAMLNHKADMADRAAGLRFR